MFSIGDYGKFKIIIITEVEDSMYQLLLKIDCVFSVALQLTLTELNYIFSAVCLQQNWNKNRAHLALIFSTCRG